MDKTKHYEAIIEHIHQLGLDFKKGMEGLWKIHRTPSMAY